MGAILTLKNIGRYLQQPYLDEEQFWLATQADAVVSCEGLPQQVGFIVPVPPVQLILLPVGHHHH